MRRTDASVGIGLALLALAVLWTARAFPDVPGQKLGAALLPMIVGAGLLLCALGLIVRSLRGKAYVDEAPRAAAGSEHFGSALVIVGAVLAYLLLSERLGFLLIAPLCLLAVMTWLVPIGDPQLKVALLLTGAMPMMGIYAILAQRHGHEGLASAALLVGTMASFFTLSGLLWLLRHSAGWLG